MRFTYVESDYDLSRGKELTEGKSPSYSDKYKSASISYEPSAQKSSQKQKIPEKEEKNPQALEFKPNRIKTFGLGNKGETFGSFPDV